MSEVKAFLLWKTLEPVTSEPDMVITPTMTLDECPPLDVVFVPGGPGKSC